jgi:hypothetical protein
VFHIKLKNGNYVADKTVSKNITDDKTISYKLNYIMAQCLHRHWTKSRKGGYYYVFKRYQGLPET